MLQDNHCPQAVDLVLRYEPCRKAHAWHVASFLFVSNYLFLGNVFVGLSLQK